MSHITNLDDTFRTWAWLAYLGTTSTSILARKPKYEQTTIDIRWDKVKVISMVPIYTPIESDPEVLDFSVISDSNYENCSPYDQEQSIKVEKTTTSTASIKLTRGFGLDTSVGLQLDLPSDLPERAKAEASFGTHLHVDSEERNLVSRTIKWEVNSKIVAKHRSCTKVELVVREIRAKYTFSMVVKMKGRIIAVVTNLRNGRQIQIEGDVATIVRDMKRNDSLKKFVDAVVNPGSNTVHWSVAGTADYRYGVSATVRTNTYDLVDEA